MSETILNSEYSEVMQKSYIDYAMSVICARAVPDVRDGLKPVQRRVLYAMAQLGLRSDRPHRKSARIVGDTMGKYHPHGDSSIYETLVVLEQDFKKGMPLVDGHGNFGSIEGDGAAAMRYTEARLQKFTQDVYLADLDKDVVDFVPNFDETEREPSVLPVRIPNLLVNGSEGIAVGMTTSIPTHNLNEVVDAMIACMKKKSITTKELMEYIQGPDFPTGGLVINKSELLSIYETGTGKIRLRGKVELEPAKKKSDRDKLVITEIPYTMIGANIGKFILDICDLVESRKTQDIVDVSNESSKEGMRIVIELKKGSDPEKVKNLLYKKTKLEDTFGVNMLAIADGKPEILSLKQILQHCIDFQYEINSRKYHTLLEKDLEQKEIKEGLITACDIIDLIIEVIRGSQNIAQARACLTSGDVSGVKFRNPSSEKEAKTLHFTQRQAQAILDLRLSKLIGLEILQLKEEYENLLKEIAEYELILSDEKAMRRVIIRDLEKIRKEYGYERRTLICDAQAAVYEEEKIREQEVVFLMDRFGYAKTIDTAVYDKNTETVDAEHKYVIRCMNTDRICIFTQTGTMHQLKMLKLPLKKLKEKGIPIDNLCNYTSETENIIQVCSSRELKNRKMLFTTRLGMMKFVDASEFDVSKQTVSATKLLEGDEVISIEFFDAPATGDVPAAETGFSPLIEGGSEQEPDTASEAAGDDGFGAGLISSYIDPEDDQLSFEFFSLGAEEEASFEEPSFEEPVFDPGNLTEPEEQETEGQETDLSAGGPGETAAKKPAAITNKMIVIQTREGVFLRFKLSEVPEKKKGAVGVRGINLGKDDEIDKIYIVGFGDKTTIRYKSKDVELMKLKLAKRGLKGTKLRV
ncbi:MAG: DNA topoisomerase 4 subunit A [Parasporobacterium sp.]|nr:DNA topoisomerase 4 subunit A [Parasporobacterium sp.]